MRRRPLQILTSRQRSGGRYPDYPVLRRSIAHRRTAQLKVAWHGQIGRATMTISAVSPYATTSSTSTGASGQNPIGQLFRQLAQDLTSGNLSGAQSTFASLQSLFQQGTTAAGSPAASATTASSAASPASSATATAGTANSGNSLSADIQNLSQALQSGDVTTAQAAFQKFAQAAAQATGAHRGGHHHHGGGHKAASATSSTASAGTASAATAATSSSTLSTSLLSLLNPVTSTATTASTSPSTGSGSLLNVVA